MNAVDDANSEGGEGFCCQSFARKVSVRARHSHLMMTIKNMFSPGCRGGLRNRQLLMNLPRRLMNVRLVARASGRLLGRLLSRECVCTYLGLHPPSWETFPEGVSMERDLVECTQASSARWANRLINDHYGPHRSAWYRRSSSRATADDAGGSAAMVRIAKS